MISYKTINVGDRVVVCDFAGQHCAGEVTEVTEDIKNGFPGISYIMDCGRERWAYDNQVIRLQRRPK